MNKPADHPFIADGKIGVLLVNLGTPDGYGYRPMRRYLKEFLSDRRVIETNPWVWKIILNCFILTTRPQKSGAAYQSIWNHEKDESPLRTITRAQSDAITRKLAKASDGMIITDWAMRYGTPSIDDVLSHMVEQGARRVLLCALYPQYSAATMATAYDEAFNVLQKMRWQPAIRTMPPYHDDVLYIDALARSHREWCGGSSWQPEVTLVSFHGLPKEYFMKGDPYHCHCAKTYRLLRESLNLTEDQFMMTFQSRFGPAEWLQPYTDETIKALAEKGVRRLAVMMPGFVADCIETLEEIAIEGKEIFLAAGGQKYDTIPCLNETDYHMEALTHLIMRQLAGWL